MQFAKPLQVGAGFEALVGKGGVPRVTVLTARMSEGRFEPSQATLYRIGEGVGVDHQTLPTLGHVAMLAACAYLHARKRRVSHNDAHYHLEDVMFGVVGDAFEQAFEEIVDNLAHIGSVRDIEAYIARKLDAWLPSRRAGPPKVKPRRDTQSSGVNRGDSVAASL